ncbi:FecR family protein [Sinomicrobium sp.]
MQSINDHRFRQLLEKYEKGITTDEENLLVESFFVQMQSNGIEPETIRNDLRLKHKIFKSVRSKTKNKSALKYSLWMAASIIAILGLLSIRHFYSPESQFKTVTTQDRQQIIYLSDSSRVTLGINSKIVFPEKFEDNLREIQLEGRAFFEVQKNPEAPFIVKTSTLKTEVLGTSFSVSNDAGGIPEVIVLTGRVKVSNYSKTAAIVLPNERVRLIKNQLNRDVVNAWMQVSWKEGGVFFEDASFREVIHTLEEKYNCHIRTEEIDVPKHLTLSGDFRGQSLTDVLESIKFIFQIDYKVVESKSIVINKPEKAYVE